MSAVSVSRVSSALSRSAIETFHFEQRPCRISLHEDLLNTLVTGPAQWIARAKQYYKSLIKVGKLALSRRNDGRQKNDNNCVVGRREENRLSGTWQPLDFRRALRDEHVPFHRFVRVVQSRAASDFQPRAGDDLEARQSTVARTRRRPIGPVKSRRFPCCTGREPASATPRPSGGSRQAGIGSMPRRTAGRKPSP